MRWKNIIVAIALTVVPCVQSGWALEFPGRSPGKARVEREIQEIL